MERRLVTSDCHIAAPFSLLEELPESYREYFPRLRRHEGGVDVLRRGHPAMAMTAGAGSGKTVEDEPRALARAAVCNVLPEAEPSFDPAEQLADLERDGVYGAVLIGRFEDFDSGTPPEVDIAYCRLVNDWLADTWGPYLARVAPGIHLPYRDVAASVKELERSAAMGLRPALLPDGIYGRPYYLPEWEPLWEAAAGLKVPITMHVSGLRNAPATEVLRYPGQEDIGWYKLCFGMGETLGWLTYSGVFARYPDLHVVMTEGYAAWLGFAIQFFDHHWSDSRLHDLDRTAGGMSLADMNTSRIDAPPGVYLRRQAHATFMWDPLAIQARDIIGLDCLLWGNDYPHYEGSFPSSQEWIGKQFAGVPEADVDAIVRGNASRLFGINV
ncbi:MAG: amidohydrolase family protein [Acidimicrobiales bacterium]